MSKASKKSDAKKTKAPGGPSQDAKPKKAAKSDEKRARGTKSAPKGESSRPSKAGDENGAKSSRPSKAAGVSKGGKKSSKTEAVDKAEKASTRPSKVDVAPAVKSGAKSARSSKGEEVAAKSGATSSRPSKSEELPVAASPRGSKKGSRSGAAPPNGAMSAFSPAAPAASPSSSKAKGAPFSGPPPSVGAPAPQFSLVADDGRSVSLADLRGKKVVLYFYPKDLTPGCTVEACAFRDAYDEILDAGAVVLGVSRDTVQKHQRFRDKEGLPFRLLSDPNAEVISAYGSWGPRKFMGRSFDGILRTTVLIDPEGRVFKVYPKVTPKEHAREILADLGSMR